MRKIHLTIPVPNCIVTAGASVAPVVSMVRRAGHTAWAFYRTWGLHPLHPDHGNVALQRARVRGGVRL